MAYNISLSSGILVEKFKLGMMVPQRAKKAPKILEGFPVLLSVAVQETQNNIKDRGSKHSMVELKKTLIHQH